MIEAVIKPGTPEYKATLREAIPLLTALPDTLYDQLDTSELALPVGLTASLRQQLEAATGHFAVTYTEDTFRLDIPVENHLCANVAGARLSEGQERLLKQYEEMTKPNGVTLVVYEKPLKLIKPSESWIYSFYKQQALI